MIEDRPLFLPLKKIFFDCYKDKSKIYELRGINNIFNSKTIFENRQVILSVGYSKKQILNGKISKVLFYQNLKQIKDDGIFKYIIPEKFYIPDKNFYKNYDDYIIALNFYKDSDVCNFIKEYFKKYKFFIVFKIDILEN